jgi:hypothetical protein
MVGNQRDQFQPTGAHVGGGEGRHLPGPPAVRIVTSGGRFTSAASSRSRSRAYPVELMESWPVSEAVNDVKSDGPELIRPVTRKPQPAQPSLFDSAA